MKNAILTHVRALRKNSTNAERHLWHYLRAKRLSGYKFRRQYLIDPYVVDFVCLSKKLIIECDGGQHIEQQAYDKERQDFLEAQGYRVIRFWNSMILKDMPLVLDMIFEVLEGRVLLPLPLPLPS
jgi:very-short-patch-repair endonuclease